MENGLLALSGIFGGAVAAYVLVSFVAMRAHTEPRPLSSVLRAIAREALWVVLTQPLLPFWYLVGRRWGAAQSGAGVPVVLVHGYLQNRVNFLRIGNALSAAGAGPVYGFNYNTFADIRSSARRLATFIEDVRKAHDAPRVDLVAYSMGGLLVMEYLSAPEHAARVRRCVSIASPHAGVTWRLLLGTGGLQLRRDSEYARIAAARTVEVPFLSIYSSHDNLVHPPSTSSLAHRGGRDVVVPHLGHMAILFSPRVVEEVVGFLVTETAVAPEGLPTS